MHGLLFNLVSGATAVATGSTGNSAQASFRLASYNNFPYIAGPANSAFAAFVAPGSVGSNDVYPTLLIASDNIGSANNFAADNTGPQYGNYAYLSANFTNQRGFVGLRFEFNGNQHYGWADVTHLGAGSGTTLHAFGYNDTPDAPSHPVPEPSSLLLLAAGAAGLAGFRRRKTVA